MSEPTTKEEMLAIIERTITLMRINLSILPNDYSDEHRKRIERDLETEQAIRARLLAYDKLEKNYTELLGKIKTLQNITKEAEESGGYYIWLRKMLFVAKSIRDHREGK